MGARHNVKDGTSAGDAIGAVAMSEALQVQAIRRVGLAPPMRCCHCRCHGHGHGHGHGRGQGKKKRAASWQNKGVTMRSSFVLTVLLICTVAVAADDPLPWEIWDDLGELARLRLDHQVVMNSSRCPDGCRYDRHSDGDSRFIRTIGDEGVIFEATGAGAITRIWMTQGDGISEPLDGDISIRITLDGAADPVIDLPLPEFFGVTAPFEPPLAVDRTVSSGGNSSYVPIAFREGCRVSLIGAETKKIWFQVGAHLLASADGVTTFTGSEDLTAWRTLVDSPGSDPWADTGSHTTVAGAVSIDPGETDVLASMAGPDSLSALVVDAPRSSWSDLELVLDFDGRRRTVMRLDDFFAVGRAGGDATRSLLVGVRESDELYCYFPMPFFQTATVDVRLTEAAAAPVNIGFEIRRRGVPPVTDSGLFGASLQVVETSTPGQDSAIVELDGPGRWVGLFLEVGSVDSTSKLFLEGDERIHLDLSPHPTLYGTGVEDIFGGGFYYRIDSMTSVPFRRALHGMTYEVTDSTGVAMGMYRLMLTDAPIFGRRMLVGLEAGPVNQTPVRFRAVAYAYRRSTPPMRRRDLLDLGDIESRLDHLYTVPGDPTCAPLDALFESEPPGSLEAENCTRGEGSATFVMRGAQVGQGLVLRRRFDAGGGDQRADLSVAGGTGPSLGFEGANPHRRWREREAQLGVWGHPSNEVALSVAVVPPQVDFSESTWELWAGYPPGTCDLAVNGVCDAADTAQAIVAADNGGTVEDLLLTLAATFD